MQPGRPSLLPPELWEAPDPAPAGPPLVRQSDSSQARGFQDPLGQPAPSEGGSLGHTWGLHGFVGAGSMPDNARSALQALGPWPSATPPPPPSMASATAHLPPS